VSSTLRPVPPRPGRSERAGVSPARPLGIVAIPAVPRTPLEATLEVMDGRFKTLIVWHLFWGARSFGQLMRSTAGLTKKGLRQQLAEMEQHGIVRHEAPDVRHPRATYALTPLGETLKPMVGAMYEWGLLALRRPFFRRPPSSGPGASRP
jgi:DNA-binding HxlR family transcriptional regulator